MSVMFTLHAFYENVLFYGFTYQIKKYIPVLNIFKTLIAVLILSTWKIVLRLNQLV